MHLLQLIKSWILHLNWTLPPPPPTPPKGHQTYSMAVYLISSSLCEWTGFLEGMLATILEKGSDTTFSFRCGGTAKRSGAGEGRRAILGGLRRNVKSWNVNKHAGFTGSSSNAISVCACVCACVCVCALCAHLYVCAICVCVCVCVCVHACTFVGGCPLCSTATRVRVHVRTWLCKYSDFAEVIQAPRVQCQDCTKRNREPKLQQPRGHETYTCATTNPELGIFWTGKQMNHKTCLEILMIMLLFFVVFLILLIFECWKCRRTKYAQTVWAQVWNILTSNYKPLFIFYLLILLCWKCRPTKYTQTGLKYTDQ